ncbi:hypothetical protein EMCRGX_G008349 [Ephydatia muelleri]
MDKFVVCDARLCAEEAWGVRCMVDFALDPVGDPLRAGVENRFCIEESIAGHVQVINHHELARDLHADQQYFIIDCRPVFAYNVCHISGAINEGKAKFQSSVGGATVVYDDSSGDMKDLSATHPLVLVMSALMGMGKCYLLRVVIEAQAEASPVNEGTVVWSQEKECLGEIFETFGPVKNPFYSLLINSEQELGPSLAPGQLIYVVSNNQSLTSYVFTAELMKQRGCDASWRGDIEVPSEMQEHSDDDAECKSKKKDREDKPRKKDEKRDRLQKTSSVVYTSDPMMKAYFQGPSALSQGAPPPAMGMVPPVPYGYPPPPLQGNGFSHMANIKLTLLISLPKHTPVDPAPYPGSHASYYPGGSYYPHGFPPYVVPRGPPRGYQPQW